MQCAFLASPLKAFQHAAIVDEKGECKLNSMKTLANPQSGNNNFKSNKNNNNNSNNKTINKNNSDNNTSYRDKTI